jgi:hypothetical protein
MAKKKVCNKKKVKGTGKVNKKETVKNVQFERKLKKLSSKLTCLCIEKSDHMTKYYHVYEDEASINVKIEKIVKRIEKLI